MMPAMRAAMRGAVRPAVVAMIGSESDNAGDQSAVTGALLTEDDSLLTTESGEALLIE